MSVESIPTNQTVVTPLQVVTSVERTSNPELEIPLDFESAHRLLAAYTEHLESQTKINHYHCDMITGFRSLSFSSFFLLLIPFLTSIIIIISPFTNKIYAIVILFLVFLIIFYFIRRYFSEMIKNTTIEYLLKHWFSLRNIIVDTERLTYLANFIRDHEPLMEWQKLELKVRLQRAESVLMEARATLGRYKPKENAPNKQP
jgi:hypothetical protein